MAFSSLYSAICRGKWFISFRDVESNLILVDKLLERGITKEDTSKLSDAEPIDTLLFGDGKEAKSGNNFSDAPIDSTAIIPVHGTLLKYGTYCNYGTTELAEVLCQAADSPNISSIVVDIDSGGGSVDAIAPLVDAIQYTKSKGKTVVAHCDMCASAAYYVAVYCDEIIASNDISSEFGSIGVMMSFPDYAKYYEKEGVKVHTVYSNLSDYKNAPFEAAKRGEYDLVKEEELDPLARGFQESVKKHRCSLKMETVGLLRGRMFYARDAVNVGLVDSIGTRDFAIQRAREIRNEACINGYINSKL